MARMFVVLMMLLWWASGKVSCQGRRPGQVLQKRYPEGAQKSAGVLVAARHGGTLPSDEALPVVADIAHRSAGVPARIPAHFVIVVRPAMLKVARSLSAAQFLPRSCSVILPDTFSLNLCGDTSAFLPLGAGTAVLPRPICEN